MAFSRRGFLTAALMLVLAAGPAGAQGSDAQGNVVAAAAPPVTRVLGGEAYAEPNFRDFVMMTVMLGGIDITAPGAVDEYARFAYCPLYKEKYTNDFEWNPIRQELIRRVQTKSETFRTRYEVTGMVYLGRYNFEMQEFPFDRNSAMRNVGMLAGVSRYAAHGQFCGLTSKTDRLNTGFQFKLQQPITFDKLRIPMDDAEKLLDKMQRMHITDRRMYVRMQLRVKEIDESYSMELGQIFDLVSEVMAIDLFFDKALTRHYKSIYRRG